MRLLILSDLHLELWRTYAPRINPQISRPDIVILAGDIHKGAEAIPWAEKLFFGIPVLYVLGNHEFYGGEIGDVVEQVQIACARSENVKFLNRGKFIFEGIRFLGVTLWTDFCLFGEEKRTASMRVAEEVITDYQMIRCGSGAEKLRANNAAQLYALDKSWLESTMDESFSGKTVVISHMAPSMNSIAKKYVENLASAAFASHLDGLVSHADLWIHGHMHESLDYYIGNCRVVCNPCGYMTRGGGIENEKFDANFTVTIG